MMMKKKKPRKKFYKKRDKDNNLRGKKNNLMKILGKISNNQIYLEINRRNKLAPPQIKKLKSWVKTSK